MSADASDGGVRGLAPDDAFAVLGNEVRMEIIQALGEADGPLSFSELHDRISLRDSGQFNYHLDQLVDHFVEAGDDGYELRQAGRRVIEAILSGSVTQAPNFDLTVIDEACHYCEAPIAVRYGEERLEIFCTECEGTYRGSGATDRSAVPEAYGALGTMFLPPAGVDGRPPEAAYRAAWTWTNFEILAMSGGVCPRCSGSVETTVDCCGDHADSGGLCEHCGRRRAVFLSLACTVCNYEIGGGIFLAFATLTPLVSFLLDHGINPISPEPDDFHEMNRVHEDYAEVVLETDPLEARFTITVDDAEFSLRTDQELRVLEVTR